MTDAARSDIAVNGRSSPSGRATYRAPAPQRRHRLLSPHFFIFAVLFLLGLVAFDFIRFSDGVARLAAPSGIKAEGIVALTGGAARIDGALALLADGRGERLLISGVNPSVGRREIARAVDNESRVAFDQSVDLGHSARDTIGNADEAKAWARKNGFRSLIVVTSDYHMPRSMIELSGAMPDVALIPYPVSNPHLDMGRWWRHVASVKLLMAEYLKYTLARARLAVESPWGTTATAPVETAATGKTADGSR
ncbi:YdcF family protein [Kaistia soli]|nr:YdcF family protein [Kaistia soli]